MVIHSNFDSARSLFSSFRERLLHDKELQSAFEAAISMLRASYNTAIYENRFTIGGAIEHLVVATFNGAGLPAQHIGRGDARVDVTAHEPSSDLDAGFSIKASFSSFNVRLINMLGQGNPSWVEPTLFLLSGVGIAYADPLLLPNATKQTSDAILMDGKLLKSFVTEHPEYVIPFAFKMPPSGTIATSKTASEDVARSIVKNFPRLSLP